VRILKKYGISIDCAVMPYHSIAPSSEKFPAGAVDYSDCKNGVYEIDLGNFRKRGLSGFFEVPLTAFDFHPLLRKVTAKLNKKISERKFGMIKLRPEQGNLENLIRIVSRAEREHLPFIEFMLHSSETMPGCSLAFPSKENIENLYTDIDMLFSRIAKNFTGMTLKEYVRQYHNGKQ
jgi:hypothetical protein